MSCCCCVLVLQLCGILLFVLLLPFCSEYTLLFGVKNFRWRNSPTLHCLTIIFSSTVTRTIIYPHSVPFPASFYYIFPFSFVFYSISGCLRQLHWASRVPQLVVAEWSVIPRKPTTITTSRNNVAVKIKKKYWTKTAHRTRECRRLVTTNTLLCSNGSSITPYERPLINNK